MPAVVSGSQDAFTFCRREKKSKRKPIFYIFVAVHSGFEIPQVLQTFAPAVVRLCSSKGLIRGALPKAPAQKTPSAPQPTLAAEDCPEMRVSEGGAHLNRAFLMGKTLSISACLMLSQNCC